MNTNLNKSIEAKFSIIIPVKEINDYIQESVSYILNQEYKNFETLILPDKGALSEISLSLTEIKDKVKIIPTGPFGPAVKRNIGAENAKGEFLAFLDDDSYPRKDWLTNALKHFEDEHISAVVGPGVTPKDNSFWQKVSGAVFLSPLGGGNTDRYWPGKGCYYIDDWASVNLIMRMTDFEKIGGFNSQTWPGEDTKLCLDLIYKLKKKIIYDPSVLVWHHRRKGLRRHLTQIGKYGVHRGFFVKKYPENSRRFKYFVPSCIVIYLILGLPIVLINNHLISIAYLLGIAGYLSILIIALFQIHLKTRNFLISLTSIFYVFLTHIWYGVRFLQGLLFTKELKTG